MILKNFLQPRKHTEIHGQVHMLHTTALATYQALRRGLATLLHLSVFRVLPWQPGLSG